MVYWIMMIENKQVNKTWGKMVNKFQLHYRK